MALMQVSRRVDYALRAAINLARQEPGRASSVGEISRPGVDPEEVPREDHPGPDPRRAGGLAARRARRLHAGARSRRDLVPRRHGGGRGSDRAQRLRRRPHAVLGEPDLRHAARVGRGTAPADRSLRRDQARGPGRSSRVAHEPGAALRRVGGRIRRREVNPSNRPRMTPVYRGHGILHPHARRSWRRVPRTGRHDPGSVLRAAAAAILAGRRAAADGGRAPGRHRELPEVRLRDRSARPRDLRRRAQLGGRAHATTRCSRSTPCARSSTSTPTACAPACCAGSSSASTSPSGCRRVTSTTRAGASSRRRAGRRRLIAIGRPTAGMRSRMPRRGTARLAPLEADDAGPHLSPLSRMRREADPQARRPLPALRRRGRAVRQRRARSRDPHRAGGGDRLDHPRRRRS